jgi:hypothetical protein
VKAGGGHKRALPGHVRPIALEAQRATNLTGTRGPARPTARPRARALELPAREAHPFHLVKFIARDRPRLRHGASLMKGRDRLGHTSRKWVVTTD